MNPARLRWGILFILAGTIFLLINYDVLEWYVWDDILALWPVILIAIGIEKIFSKSDKLIFISYLAPVAFAGVVLWVAFTGYGGHYGFIDRVGSNSYKLDTDDEITKLVIDMDVNNVDVIFRESSSSTFRCRYNGLRYKPDIDYDFDDGIGTIEITEKRSYSKFIRTSRDRDYKRWTCRVTDEYPLSIKFVGNKSDMDIDCSSLNIEELRMESERGDINMQLGDLSDNIKLFVEGKDGEFTIKVPEVSGLKIIESPEEFGNLFERIGLIEVGGVYQTEGFEQAANKIELDIASDVSQLSIDFY